MFVRKITSCLFLSLLFISVCYADDLGTGSGSVIKEKEGTQVIEIIWQGETKEVISVEENESKEQDKITIVVEEENNDQLEEQDTASGSTIMEVEIEEKLIEPEVFSSTDDNNTTSSGTIISQMESIKVDPEIEEEFPPTVFSPEDELTPAELEEINGWGALSLDEDIIDLTEEGLQEITIDENGEAVVLEEINEGDLPEWLKSETIDSLSAMDSLEFNFITGNYNKLEDYQIIQLVICYFY